MSKTPWFCPNCGHQNQPTSGYCPQCGTAFPSGHAYAPATQKKNGALKYVAIGCLGMAGLAFALIVAGVLLSKPSDKEITVEMMPVLPPPGEGKASSGVARLEQMPEFSEIAAAARDLGFRVKSFGDGQPSADSLTGRAFMATSEQMINGQRFQIVVMGPSSERVDTVRLQAFGIQTKAARQVLQKQAGNILDALDRGAVAGEFCPAVLRWSTDRRWRSVQWFLQRERVAKTA